MAVAPSRHILAPAAQWRGRFSRLRWILGAVAGLAFVVGVIGTVAISPTVGLLVAAFIFGWTQIVGPCGRSLVATLGPASKVPTGRRAWTVNATIYTLAGLMTSGCVGLVVGLAGPVFHAEALGWGRWVLVLGVALILAARDAGWVSIPLPQIRRQTDGRWNKLLPWPVAAALWGGDIGLIFTTWLTFSGIWVLLGLGLVAGSPLLSLGLFVCYWLGRAASIWLAPVLLSGPKAAPSFLREVVAQRGLLRWIHLTAIFWFCVVLAMLAVSSGL